MELGSGGFDFLNESGCGKWFLNSTGQFVVNLSGTLARTGIGCLVIDSGAFGPVFGIPSGPGGTGGLIWEGAYFQTAMADNSGVVKFGNPGLPPPNIIDANTTVFVMGNGSVRVTRGNGNVLLGQSAAGVCNANAYNFFSIFIVESATVGVFLLYVNGLSAPVLQLTNVNTMPFGSPSTGWQFLGFGGLSNRHDDWRCCDTLGGRNNTLVGPGFRSRSYIADADSVFRDFTPSIAGPNYQMTVDIPQQIVHNVHSSVVGAADGYHYGIAIPGQTVLSVQHNLYAGVDAGARSLQSAINGAGPVSGHSKALTVDPQFLTEIYETTPTGGTWVESDFAALKFGPRISA